MHPLSTTLDEVSDIVADFNEAGATAYLNRAGLRFFGVDGTADGALPAIDRWYSPDDIRKIREVALPAAIRGGRWQGNLNLRDGHGLEHRIEQVIVPRRSAEGDLSGFTTIIRLDPAVPGAPAQTAAPEGMFTQIFRVSPYAAIITDMETRRIVDVSDRLCVFLGQDRDALVGSINSRDVWADPQECQLTYAELERAGMIYDREVRLIDHAGRIRTGLFSGVIITWNGRRCVHAVFEDLTELDVARKALLDSEQLFAKAFFASPDPYVIADFDTNLMLEVNDAYCRLFGVTREEAVGRKNSDLGLWADLKHRDEFIDRLQRIGMVHEMEQHRRNRAGKTVICRVTAFRTEIGGRACTLFRMRDITRERQTEQALSESEEKFSKAFHVSPDPIAIGEFPSGRITEANDAFCRMFGYSLHEIVGRSGADLGLWADVHDRDRFVGLLNTEGTVHGLEADKLTRDGRRITCRITSSRMEIKGRTRIVTRFADITKQRRIEQALRESEEKFAKAFHAAPDPIAIGEFPSGRIAEANDAFCSLFGYAREEVIGRSGAELGLWSDPGERTGFFELLGRGGTAETEMEHAGRDGRRLTCRIIANRLEISGRQRMVTRFTDITDRHQAERALRESEEKFQKAFHAMPDSVAVITLAEGRVLDITEGFTRMTGWSREEALGRTVEDLGLWADVSQRDLLLGRLPRGDAIRSEPMVARDRAGGLHQCLFTAVELEIAGQPCRLSIARDITEQQRLEEQLRQAQKMESIGQLAGGVAHDFNNILTVIQGHASFLLHDRMLAPSVRDSVLQIQQSAVFAADLTRQLLLFSRRQPIQPGPVSLTEIVGRTKRLLDRVIGEQIVLDVSVSSDLPAANADAGMVEQVLLNLVVNARDAMPGGGHIAVTGSILAADETYVRQTPQARLGRFAGLKVSDTGGGIPPEILPRIFDPFFTTKAEGKGTGLGLATVYGIVQQHGGWIEVESQPARGTTFTVWFPLADREPEKGTVPATPLPEAVARGHETVLVVEDKADVRAVLQAVLERFGYGVLMADDGAGAVRCWTENRTRIGLLFTDVMMPGGMTGRDLAERLRREQPGLKVIFCSGYDANVLDAATLQAPGTRFLSKPFDIARLVSTVRELLDAK